MTTRERASLFLDSVVGSSGCSDTVATWDRVERLLVPSTRPLRLSGRTSDARLGERDNWREDGRDRALFAEAGRPSANGVPLVSTERDLRCPRACCDSPPRAAAAAIPAPPLPLAFLFATVASSKRSRFRLGESGTAGASSCGGRNWASTFEVALLVLSAGDADSVSNVARWYRRSDDSGNACTRSSGRSCWWASGCSGDDDGGVGSAPAAVGAIVP
jgi:hypothetical protein